MRTKEDILEVIKSVLEELFEVDPDRVTPSAELYSDLDLDSIDAVDLVIKLKEMTGKMVKPDEFKNVRKVGDVVDVVYKLIHE